MRPRPVTSRCGHPTAGPVGRDGVDPADESGGGYEYLLRTVARGDVTAPAASPLTRYYAESGTPPGYWLGSGLAGLGDGAGLAVGNEVSQRQLFHLLGMLEDPITGQPLGRLPQRFPAPLGQRIAARVDAVPADLDDAARAEAVAAIEAEERVRERSIKRPVAGFDLTFSVPKSVSAVWAVADPATQAAIHAAHRDAIRMVLGWAEEQVFCSRTGANGVLQEPVRGVVAAAFDHWDSRAGDPHLHTHVVVANRVQTLDGVWRTLDSRTLHKYVVALSELHEGVVQDLLAARLGYAWAEHARRHSPVPRHDIDGVPRSLVEEFSRRSQDIETTKNQLVARFTAEHGRQPSPVEVLRLRQQATLETRPDKQLRTLAEQVAAWTDRARLHIGPDPARWAAGLAARNVLPVLTAADVDPPMLREAAVVALATVGRRRSTFSHGNVLAEVHRQLHGLRFATPADRLQVADRMTDAALDQALPLTPPGPAVAIGTPRRARERVAAIFTTREILDAETRLLDAGRDTTGPAVHPATVTHILTASVPGRSVTLGPDQAAAVAAVATSGRTLDLLVGPAGTGKTVSLAALRAAWETTHGPGSVLGLAPSAAAAEVLADELGIDTENTAKWLHETTKTPARRAQLDALADRIQRETSSPSTVHARRLHARLNELEADWRRWTLRPGQLVLIDEAGLAGTLALDAITTQARRVGAKVVLVGDRCQLAPIDAGGAFGMLAADRPDTPTLTGVRRFTHEWERDASLQLRAGDHAAIDAYQAHGRIQSGDPNAMLDQLYRAWRADTDAGLDTIMIADDHASVAELNLRARAERLAAGEVSPETIDVAAGGVAGIGDHVITRQNDRRLRTTDGRWVRNGDTWTVHTVHRDGSLVVQRRGAATDEASVVVLPPTYATRHVELGYATTTHRAQGRTVDTAHALITATTTRESLSVAATRARTSNTLYVDHTADRDPDTVEWHDSADADEILRAVLDRTAAALSAHETLQQLAAGNPIQDRQSPEFTTTGVASSPWPAAPMTRSISGPQL